MEDPADQPTISWLLRDFGIDSMLDPEEYSELLAALERRDNIMRTDAAEVLARKHILAALDRIIKEV